MKAPQFKFSPVFRRHGFSFTEVLFAVVILGIGFIMVAAIFPVAIQQSKLTIDETTGAAVARGSINYLERAMTDFDRTVTPPVKKDTSSNCKTSGAAAATVQQISDTYPAVGTGNPTLWAAIRGNLVLPEDPRYAFVSLYRRGGTDVTVPQAASAQVYIFAVQSQIKSIFDPATDAKPPAISGIYTEVNLMAHSVKVAVKNNIAALGGVDLIVFDTSASGTLETYNALGTDGNGAPVEGGYVIIADDQFSGTSRGKMNGHIYKLGARRVDLDDPAQLGVYFPSGEYGTLSTGIVFELDPSNDFTPEAGVDGVNRHYQSGESSVDDIVGIGNTGPLTLDLPTSASNPAIQQVQMSSGPTASATANAFVVGRGYTEPSNPSGGFSGSNMVVGLYTTFVKVN